MLMTGGIGPLDADIEAVFLRPKIVGGERQLCFARAALCRSLRGEAARPRSMASAKVLVASKMKLSGSSPCEFKTGSH